MADKNYKHTYVNCYLILTDESSGRKIEIHLQKPVDAEWGYYEPKDGSGFTAEQIGGLIEKHPFFNGTIFPATEEEAETIEKASTEKKSAKYKIGPVSGIK